MKNKFIFAVILLFSCAVFVRVQACTCQSASVCQSYSSSDAIFVGKAASVKKQGSKEFTTFEIKEMISGTPSTSFVVQNREGTTCDTTFSKGETYLIFASGDAKKGYSSHACSGNLPFTKAQEVITELKNLPSKGAGGQLYGSVLESFTKRKVEYAPMTGVEITIHEIGGKGKIYQAVTDAAGNYQTIVPQGKYKIVPTVPVYAYFDLAANSPVSVIDRGCVEKQLSLYNKAEVNGKIIDADGKPVPDLSIELVGVGDEPTLHGSERTDSNEQGEFSFITVPSGKYTLSVSFVNNFDLESPFRTTFYPLVFDRKEAKIFDIGLGQSIENLIFRLPPRIKVQKITGKVVFPGGKPAAGMTVNLQRDYSDRSFSHTRTDVNGDFELEDFSGKKYNLGVEYYGDNRAMKDYTVKKTIFTLEENMSPIRLVLEKNK